MKKYIYILLFGFSGVYAQEQPALRDTITAPALSEAVGALRMGLAY